MYFNDEMHRMHIKELIERLERAGIDPAFNDEVIEALRDQQAEIAKMLDDIRVACCCTDVYDIRIHLVEYLGDE